MHQFNIGFLLGQIVVRTRDADCNGVIVKYFGRHWVVTAAHIARAGVEKILDYRGEPVGKLVPDAWSYGYADVCVFEIACPTVKGVELCKAAPLIGYLAAAPSRTSSVPGETFFHRAYSGGTVCHTITPCVPGDSGAPGT